MLYIKAIVTTKAKKEIFFAKSHDHFLISLKEKAEKNMANKKVIELLAIYFKISKNKVRIINGHHHPHKLLVIDNSL